MISNLKRFISRTIVIGTVLVLGFSASAVQAATADFELRLAPSETDAILNLSDPSDLVLDLELWVTLDAPSNIIAYSVYLEPSADGVISFDSNFQNAAAFDSPLGNGLDNAPVSGAFGRAVFSPLTGPVPISADATKLATFSVTALSEGVVEYSFFDLGAMRPWSMDLDPGNFQFVSAAVSQASPAMTITVVPEPTSVVLVLAAVALVVRRGRRMA